MIKSRTKYFLSNLEGCVCKVPDIKTCKFTYIIQHQKFANTKYIDISPSKNLNIQILLVFQESYLRISMSSLQYETKSWPFIDDEITIGRPVLILDQINACENKGGINHCAIAT